jgi:hypothetical protein
MKNLTKETGEMVRDFCSVVPKIKSEVRKRIQNLLHSQATAIYTELEESVAKKELKPDRENPSSLDREELAYNQALDDIRNIIKERLTNNK